MIGSIFYPCSFLVLDSPNMEFLFGLDMLRKHQCIIDLKESVLRVGGGEVSVAFLQEKDIPSRFLDEEKYAKEASGSGGHTITVLCDVSCALRLHQGAIIHRREATLLLYLFQLVIQTVLYFVCKSYHHQNIDKSSLSDHLEVYHGEYEPLKAKDVQMEEIHV
ncbi:hypothetical protein V8G54_011657 [Vigna mungo]|uniref:Aspartic peptidase DDI1-type domain-containing protein n=1 Tax=Vigna mungo TaxID=3915 RepID=A0AAQ3NSD2_VIGMU